jgi:hypothetical protein
MKRLVLAVSMIVIGATISSCADGVRRPAAEPGPRYPWLKICNPTNSAVDDGFTSFNTLAVSY